MESGRPSVIKLSAILENKSSLFLEFEHLCQQCEKPLKEEEILSCFSKNLSAYAVRCPLCKENFVPKFKVYSEIKSEYLKGKEGMSVQLLSPVTLYKEYINIVEQKGEQVVLKEAFMREHRTVFWNIVLYFKIMRLPLFMLDLDYTHHHIQFQITSINKYLPSEKKLVNIGGGIPKQPSTRGGEQSPARKSSVGRLTSSMIDTFLGKSSQKASNGRKDSVVNGSEKDEPTENEKTQGDRRSGNIFGKRPPSSQKSGNSGGGHGGPGSAYTSLSDLDRIERVMNQAQHASKSIVKYFSKHLDEFRREQTYAKEIILSADLIDPQRQQI